MYTWVETRSIILQQAVYTITQRVELGKMSWITHRSLECFCTLWKIAWLKWQEGGWRDEYKCLASVITLAVPFSTSYHKQKHSCSYSSDENFLRRDTFLQWSLLLNLKAVYYSSSVIINWLNVYQSAFHRVKILR